MSRFIIFLLLLFVCFNQSLASNQGLILALDAPVFEQPDLNSRVLFTYRKGEKIYIHPQHFEDHPFRSLEDKAYLSKVEQDELEILKKDPFEDPIQTPSAFYTTVDKLGGNGYIPKSFVKLIYNDPREQEQHVSELQPDPTDYRLNEPLPDKYPFYGIANSRLSFSFGIGTQSKTSYPYDLRLMSEDYDPSFEFFTALQTNVVFDPEERFWFGGFLFVSRHTSKFRLEDPFFQRISNEKHLKIAIGPLASYDTFRTKVFRMTLMGGIAVFLFNRLSIEQKLDTGREEKRTFKGFSFGPRMGLSLHRLQLLDKIDLTFTGFFQFELGHSLSSDSPKSDSYPFWKQGNEDIVEFEPQASLSFHIGFQASQ